MELGFWRTAGDDPDREVLVTADGQRLTAGQLCIRSHQVAQGLRARGLQRGDTLALLVPNSAALIELALGAMEAGLYLTPINWHLVGPEVAYILDDSGARLFVSDDSLRAVAETAVSEAGLDPEAHLVVGRTYESWRDAQSADPLPDRTAGQPMHYTSGTTGRPKGVKRALDDADPDDMFAMVGLFLTLFGIEPGADNVHLTCSPLYHTAVLMWTTCSLHLGHRVVLMDRFEPTRLLELIAQEKVTTTHMVPTQFHRLLALPDDIRSNADVSTLRHVVHGAAPCPEDVKRRMIAWWGPVVIEYYAATEGGGTIAPADVWLERPGTVGRPWLGAEIRILDDDGNPLAPNEVGTVYMALSQARFEYKGDESKTNENRRDGFFTVGDVGLLDDDGYLFLRDRKSDMIITGGVNVYPAEIEGVLLAHPEVGDAAVFGIPHADWGEEIRAVIEPATPGAGSDELADDILHFAAERLARFKLPRQVDWIAEMPRDPSGKLFKRRLRDPHWADIGSQI